MDRKKELKELYKQMKPEMGIFIIRSKINNKCHIEGAKNLRAVLNSTKFKLEAGNHPYRELQREWKEYGEDSFTMEILDKLEYDKDETKTDYSDDIALLVMEWEEKIAKENLDFYNK